MAKSKHPIKELETPKYKEDLMDSIKKGNRQSVTFVKDGNEIKQYVEANPQFKTINVYDSNMKRIDNRQSKEEKQIEGEAKSAKQEAKKQSQSDDTDGPEAPQEKKRRKKQSNSI